MVTTVGELMRKNLHIIEGSASIQDTAKLMNDNNVSSLLILDKHDKPIGLVTERDLVRKVCIKDLRTSQVTNKEIMSTPLITINSKSSPPSALDLMLKHNVRHLIVIDDEAADTSKPIGIVTPLDLMRYEEYTRDDEHKDLEMILEYYI